MNERKPVNGQTVGLGCGTLIIIALLIMIFGNAGVKSLKREIGELQTQVQTLQTEVEEANTKIDALLTAARLNGSDAN